MDGATAKSNIIKAIDVLFIFVLAFICVVMPTVLKGAVLVGWEEGGDLGYAFDPVTFIGFVAAILGFFFVILFHSVKNYKY
ncbi:AcrB/AcrD/AcrF family protein [Methanohalobium sp.]|uniref:AcrB/AcrD/AcrF family protein n=1 Tax=Methanohalobium sp. TaxID=2837493 RepID=UPI0025F98049|nr:AcrB/AcrD/AcrF family protein [Methanohalobium sp.]